MWADVAWKGSWVSFLDAMLQIPLLCTASRNLAVPIDFEKIIIDPIVFKKHLKPPEDGKDCKILSFTTNIGHQNTELFFKTPDPLVRVVILPNQRKIMCPGVEFKGLQPTIMPRRGQRGNLAYEKFAFCPFVEKSAQDMESHLWEMVDLVLDNNRSKDLKVVDIFTQKQNSLAKDYQHILTLKPLREVSISGLVLHFFPA